MLLSVDAWTAPLRTRFGGAARRRPVAHGIGRTADRLTQAASRRIDRLAEADRRVALRIERRLAFLHPVNLLRTIQAACVVIGGLAVMAAIALAPTGRSTRVSVGVMVTASMASQPTSSLGMGPT